MGETIECTERNGVLHFDFLYLGESYGASKYLLVLKDHVSHYCELVVSDQADSTTTVDALLAWHSRFGILSMWVSDNGSHFKNEVVAELSRRLKTHQRFTIAYSPWINGSIERINRDVLQVLRVMLMEYKVSHHDWVYLVPLVQASLNHTKVPSLDNHAPVEVFTGLPCPSPLREFYCSKYHDLVHAPDDSAKLSACLAKLRQSLRDMHKQVKNCKAKQQAANRKRAYKGNTANFEVGDYVLRSRVDDKVSNKLWCTWTGPHRIIRADEHSFRIQHLVTEDEVDVHPSRLKYYADDQLNVTQELIEHVSAQGTLLTVQELKQHHWNADIGDYPVLVALKGLQEIDDSLEPLKDLAKSIPALLSAYAARAGDGALTQWLASKHRIKP